MKKVLLSGAAVLGLAISSAPAQANLNLGIEGFYRGYAVYADDDANPSNTHDFDFRRDTELHFTGEVTLDNGLTVGVHHELNLGSTVTPDESYAYFSGSWGRINAGAEDGAAYLLQVAAPSADSNVDGQRVYIQGIGPAGAGLGLSYDHADFRQTERLTYLTPKINGFQAGVSYAGEEGLKPTGIAGMTANNTPDEFENLWEAAARWDGEFQGFGVSLGAGYSRASLEAAGAFSDALQTWNVGANVAFNAFTIGAAYLRSETEDAAGADLDDKTWVVGAGWDNGPYHLGISHYDTDREIAGVEAKRTTIGGGYTFGPGMSFRGAVAFGDVNTGAGDEDFTQITLGTDIAF